MKAMKPLMLGIAVALAVLFPLQGAHAWDRYGGDYYGRWGGYHGGYHGGYYGGGGCRNCGGAAVAGLVLGTIVGAAMIDAARPPVVVAPPPPVGCRSIRVNGVLYHNCDGY